MVSVGRGRSEDRLYRRRVATRINSTCVPGSGDPGGKWGRYVGGVGGVENAWRSLSRWSFVPVRFPARVQSVVAVRRERRHHALGLSTPTRGFFAVARLTRLDETVAGGGFDLYSTVPSTAFAGSRDGVLEQFRGLPGAVHLFYMIAQLEGSVGDVARKRRGCLRRKVQCEL